MKAEKRDIIEILSDYRAAFILVSINVFVFFFLKYGNVDKSIVSSLVLSPANLYKGNIFCLITSGFIHADISHLGFNMLGVFIFAGIVQRHFGIWKTLFIYLGALFISMLLSTLAYTIILHKNVAIIGASGALMGLVSTAMLLDPFRITFEMIVPLPVMLKAWFFFYADCKGFLGGEKDGVSHLAHLFGFISIAFLVYCLDKAERNVMRKGLIINVLTFIVFFIANQWMIRKTGKPVLLWLNL